MWNKISDALSTAWLLALIVVFAGIGFLVMHYTGLGIVVTLAGVIYLCYTLYWSLSNSSSDPQNATKKYVAIVTILFALGIVGAFLYMIIDASK